MFKESDEATQVDDREPEEETKLVKLVNGLVDDTSNEWTGRLPYIELARQGRDVEENTELLREPVLDYDQRLSRYCGIDDPVAWRQSQPESSKEAVDRYNELARRYNELIAAPELDFGQLEQVVNAACSLYESEEKDELDKVFRRRGKLF